MKNNEITAVETLKSGLLMINEESYKSVTIE